jgi:hypothetical protein
VFFGQGGYDWNTIYNMPIWLRKFTYSKIADYNKQQTEAVQVGRKGNTTTLVDSNGNINKEEARKLNPGKVQYK